MKRTGYLIKIISFAFVALTVTACQNWMSGDMFSKVEDEVKVATAEKINVYVRFADNSFGTTTPSNLSEQKVDVPFDISAVVNNNYGFYEWAAFTTEDVNPSKNNRLLIYDETYKAEGGYGSKKLDSSVVSFLDPKSESTKCTVLVNRSDIVIVPVVAKRAVLKSRTTYPKTGDEGVVISQRIVLGFDKEMDFGSFVSCKNPSGIFEKDAEGNSVYEDSNGNKFYDWDKNKIEIRVYLNGDVYVGDKSYDYFNLPVQNEYDRTKIIISPNKSKKLPPFSVIEITIAGDVLDSDGYTMAESIEYYYTVGNTDDEGYPIFTAITGGRPRKDAKGINGVENDWSDFKGYLDTTDDSITTKLPSDSQTIDQWNDTAKNPVFTHRVRNSVDIYVKILDTINASLTPNNNTTDNDIENFVIKAKHLLYPDGSKGIGLVPEDKSTQKSYSYSNMKYHTSTKNFAYAHDSEDSYYASEYISNSYILKGETENDTPGFVFPYYFPAMPDGLIKLEFYAVDSIGNSGDAAPYAMYVIKDTTAPDIVSQASKIKSASTTAFTEWFNAETLQGLSFKVDSGNPIYDTFVKSDGAVSQVHSKFNPKKLYWSFGPSVNTMGALTEIDNTGTTAYDMSALTGSISTQGKMSFIAQISDDVGNTSSAVSMNVDVYFDSVSPATVTTSDFSDSQKFYPKTGVTGSETEKTFFTSQSSIPFELSATDSGYYDTTETSSGIAGFLIKEGFDYSAAELKTALKVTNGVLSEPLKTKTQTFSAGASPNASKKDYYVYAVDKALNHSESAVKISVVQDTTGPGISLSDYASYTYDALKEYYKENVPDTDMNCNPGTTGSVRGVLGGKYFYGSNYTGFPFTVTLINECEPYDSGAYGFKVMKNGSEVSGKSGGVSGNVTLEEGEYKIVAFDNLGNETETSTIRIVKDSDVPVVNDFSIIGTTKSGSSSSATKEQNVYVQFTASDKKTNDTGLLSFTLSGDADFTNAKLQKVSGGAASDVSDVIKELSESNTKVTFYLKNPENTEVNYKVTGIKLSDGNGLKTVNLSVKDRTRNLNAENSAVISYANSIPKVEDVLIVSTDKDMLENESLSIATKDTTVSLKLKLQDNASGISRLYINDSDTKSATGIEAPTGNVLLSSESKVLDSAGNEISGVTFVTGQSGEGSYLEFASPVNAETLTGYQITKVKMPESGGSIQEGKNLFYVVAYNEIMNRNDSAVSGSIIYDKTPPKPVVDLMAPEHFNPKLAHVNGSSYTQYYSKNDNTVWVIKSPYYMKGSGDDTRSDGKDSAGFWKATYKVDGGTEKDLSQQTEASVQITGSAEIEVYAYDAINNKSVPNATDKSCFTVKKDITAPVMSDLEIIAATGYTAKKDESLTSDAYFTNSPKVTLKFKASDAESGINYFDFYHPGSSDAGSYSLKNGSFVSTSTAQGDRIAEFLSMSKSLELWVDGVQYFRGGYDYSTGTYSSGPAGYSDRATYDSDTGKFYDPNGNETENIYFNAFVEPSKVTGTQGFRDFAFYNALPACDASGTVIEHSFEVRNIDLSILNQSRIYLNICAYDCVRNNKGADGLKANIVYDPNAPKVVKTYFRDSTEKTEFVSSDVLSETDLVVEFAENYYVNHSNSNTGIKKLNIKLETDKGTVPSSLKSSDFEVFIASSATGTLFPITACTVTSSNGELNLTLTPSSLSDDTANEKGNFSYKKVDSVEKINDGSSVNLLVIRGLQIATGGVDHEDTVSVKVTDRAGNVSVNADGNDKAVIICDKSAPQYYKTVYKNESGQVNTVNGRPAFSYISKFFGNPTVISTHAGSGVEYKPGSPNISVAPGVPSTVFEPTTGWNAGAVYSDEIYTEAVLRFNKKGSGIRSIALPSAVEKRGLYFREIDADTHTEIWVQNDDDAEPVKYEYNKDYTLSGNESNKGYPTKLTFSSSDKCPRGENCAVIIRGINMDDNGRRAVTDGYYNLWCSNVTVTSFAGKSSTTEWGLCFALDVDTPEFIYEPVTFSDVTVGSKQYTDGTGITLKGKINAKSTDNIYGSGLWALKLDNAKFTASSKLTAKAYQEGKYPTETNPNMNLAHNTSYTYVYNGSADYSKRNVPSMNASDCELAPFVFDEPATNTKFSLSGDKKTMFLNIPLDFYYGSEFSISNLELDDAILGTDGEKTINVTLVKYSGLSNDYNERVYGIQKESGKLTRQVANRYTSSNYSRDTDYFKVNRTNKITVDTTPPSVSYTLGSPFEDHTYSSSAPYSVTSTSSRQILVFSKAFGATSSNITQDIPLSSLGITDSSASTFKFYSNDTCSTEIEKVTFTQTRTKSGGKYTYQTPTAIPSSVWTKDAVGNKTQITLTAKSLSELDSATDGVYFAYGSVDTSLNLEIQTAQYAEGVTDGVKTLSTGGTGSEIFTKNDTTTLKLIPSNVQSMNIEVSTGGTNLGSDKVQTVNNAYVNVSVESGKQYKVKVISKAVSTVYSEYNITVTKDTEAPVLNAPEFTIEKVLDVNNGNAELTAGEGYYFDSTNKKIFYSKKVQPYFTVTGISDGSGAGVQWIGMNTKGTLPEEGERITQITDGTAAEVKVTFEGNANDDKGVYLSDNLGNTTDLNNPPYVIYGVLDTTAPAVSYSGTSKILSASLYVKGDGNFTVTDTISGVSASSEPVTFTNNEAVIKDNVGNSVTVYLDDTAPLVGNVSYTSGDSGKHIYSFSVMETGSGVSKIVMNGMKDLSQMNGIISLTIDGSAQTYTFSKTDDHSFLLSLSAPVKLSGKTVSMELYYGDKGDGTDGGPVWSASDVKVYDMLDNEGSGSEAALPNLNYFGQASAGKKFQIGIGSLSEQGIVYRAVSSVRNIFNPSVKDSGIVQAEEKTLENKKQSRLSNKDEVYEEKSKVLTVKEKAPKDLRKRAKNSETKIQQISESEAQVTEIISENILVSEPEIASDLISSESSAQNVQKDNYVAKESPDVYNYIILAVFAVILLLAVTGGVIMFLVQKRRTVQNK